MDGVIIPPEGVKRRLKEVVDRGPPDECCEALDRDYIGDESNDDEDDKIAHDDESEEESDNDEQGMQKESKTSRKRSERRNTTGK